MCDMWYRQALPDDIRSCRISVTKFIAIATLEFRTDLFSQGSQGCTCCVSLVKMWHSQHRQGQRQSTASSVDIFRRRSHLSGSWENWGPSWLWITSSHMCFFGEGWWRFQEKISTYQHTSSSTSWSSSRYSSSSEFSSWLLAAGSSKPFSAGAVAVGAVGLTRLLATAAWTIVSWDVDRLLIEHYIERMPSVLGWILIAEKMLQSNCNCYAIFDILLQYFFFKSQEHAGCVQLQHLLWFELARLWPHPRTMSSTIKG